jgi:hypothetical protein
LQSSVNLSGFTNDLSITPSWSSITSKPVWTTLIDYGGVSLNFDLILKETIVPDATEVRNIGSPSFKWNQLHVKTISCDDVATPNVPSMDFSILNFMKSIEFSTFMNATLLKHNGESFYQISQAGNFLPLQSGVRNLGSTSAGFIGVHSAFFYGFLVSISDESLKKDIVTNDQSGLHDIEALRVVDFKWKSNGKKDKGLIAQEAREVNPDFVVENEGLLHISSYPLIISLIKSVQELSEKVKILESRNL